MTQQGTARGTRSHRFAAVINEVFTPLLANPAVSIAVGLSTGSWAWTALLAIFTGLLPAGVIFGGLRLRRISDHHVTDRDERPLIMGAILSSLIVGLVVCLVGDAPAPITAVDVAMLATLAVLAIITITVRWKISVHSAVWAGIAAMLTLTFGTWATLSFALVPVVMWGRVKVHDHTAGQVVAGAFIGLSVAGPLFWLVL